MGIGLVRGLRPALGALASTFSHDAHNFVVVGTAARTWRARSRGWPSSAAGRSVLEGGVLAGLPLPLAGMIRMRRSPRSSSPAAAASTPRRSLGVTLASPFQTMAFLALSVIPSLKLTDQGLVDVDRFELVLAGV